MVQIIEEGPSFAQRFARGIGAATESAGQHIPQYLAQREANETQSFQNEQRRKFGKFASKLTKEDLEDLPYETQVKYVENFLKARNAADLEDLKAKKKEELFNKKMSFFDKLSGDESMGQPKPKGILSPEFGGAYPENEKTFMGQRLRGLSPKDMSNENIAKATLVDPSLGRTLQHQKDVDLREEREREDFEYKKVQDKSKNVRESFKENESYVNKIYDSFEDSTRKEAILDRMNQLEEEGGLTESRVYNLLETLGFSPDWLKNPANEEYTKLGLDLLGGGTLQADYGSRVLASEFKVSMQRIPTLSQSPEGRKQIKENLRLMLLPSMLKKERMQYYIDKAERTGEPLPHNLRGKVLSDIKPKLEEAYDKFKQRNGRYKVSSGTRPNDEAIEKYYYLSNGNEEKAMRMMEQDGYDIL